MTFDEITKDGRLWAVRYEGMGDNILYCTFHDWLDLDVFDEEKAKGFRTSNHPSWLRLYAIKLEPQTYVITGGTIKLTQTMQERQHTLAELSRIEKVRNFLMDNGVVDLEGMLELMQEENDKSS